MHTHRKICRKVMIMQAMDVLLPKLPALLALNLSVLAVKQRVIISYDCVYKPVSSEDMIKLLTFSKSHYAIIFYCNFNNYSLNC